MKLTHYIYIIGALMLAGCAADEQSEAEQPIWHELQLTTDVVPFVGEDAGTRGMFEGNGFDVGTWIRLKVICPYSSTSEYAESTYSGSFDAFYLLKRTGTNVWTNLKAKEDYCDINGSDSYSDGPRLEGYYEAQQTPYVYMASTWSQEKSFRTKGGGHVLQYCHVFHADQRDSADYVASDILWAQQYMQTGSWNVHLSFHHVMACLTFEVDDTGLMTEGATEDAEPVAAPLSTNAVLTLEGMPDIDQQEVIVGDYYAERSKINSGSYCYRNKNSCLYGNNGKVIGIGVNLQESVPGVLAGGAELPGGRAYAWPMTGNPNPAYQLTFQQCIPNTGTYTAYRVDPQHYRLIVPPCVLTDDAHIWVRDGERRFSMKLPVKAFREGELYPVKVTLKE